jgi:hypothetical protein
MICFKCDCEQDAAYTQETFPCGHCEEDNLIEYNICSQCGWMWRSVNGGVVEGSEVHAKDLGDFTDLLQASTNTKFNHDDLTPEEQTLMENISEHMQKVERMDSGDASMADYVHKCIQCQSTAVDVNDGLYKCTDCDFEWEMVKFD